MAIAALLAVLSVTAFSKITRGTTITTSAQVLVGAINQARQTAVSRNSDVEFRVYQLPDYTAAASGSITTWRAFQSFLVADTVNSSGVLTPGTNQLTKVTYLPSPAVISTNVTQSPFLNLTALAGNTMTQGSATASSPVLLPTYGNNYNAIVFRFSPNGGLEPTAQTLTQWFFTLYLENDPVNATTSMPYDFATVQIDQFSGAPSVFRP